MSLNSKPDIKKITPEGIHDKSPGFFTKIRKKGDPKFSKDHIPSNLTLRAMNHLKKLYSEAKSI